MDYKQRLELFNMLLSDIYYVFFNADAESMKKGLITLSKDAIEALDAIANGGGNSEQ